MKYLKLFETFTGTPDERFEKEPHLTVNSEIGNNTPMNDINENNDEEMDVYNSFSTGHDFLKDGEFNKFIQFIKEYPENLKKSDKDGNNYLHIICSSHNLYSHALENKKGIMKVIDFLIDKIDIDSRNYWGATPAYKCAECCRGTHVEPLYIDVFKKLVELGTDLSIRDNWNKDSGKPGYTIFYMVLEHEIKRINKGEKPFFAKPLIEYWETLEFQRHLLTHFPEMWKEIECILRPEMYEEFPEVFEADAMGFFSVKEGITDKITNKFKDFFHKDLKYLNEIYNKLGQIRNLKAKVDVGLQYTFRYKHDIIFIEILGCDHVGIRDQVLYPNTNTEPKYHFVVKINNESNYYDYRHPNQSKVVFAIYQKLESVEFQEEYYENTQDYAGMLKINKINWEFIHPDFMNNHPELQESDAMGFFNLK